ncbi:MAG: hypothetical protein ACLSA2_06540 [Candidatus Gastranaerophilaceae bacterium]
MQGTKSISSDLYQETMKAVLVIFLQQILSCGLILITVNISVNMTIMKSKAMELFTVKLTAVKGQSLYTGLQPETSTMQQLYMNLRRDSLLKRKNPENLFWVLVKSVQGC